MIAIISLLIPPLFMMLIREKIFRKTNSVSRKVTTYALSLIGLTFIMLFLLYYVFDSKSSLCSNLNSYNNYACKYIFLSMALAITTPYIEFFLREKVKIHLPKQSGLPKIKYFKLWISLYTIILFFLNFIRIFDNNFWGDETATIEYIMKGTFSSLSIWAAKDVHPPLYYFMLKIVYIIAGNQGWSFHLLSLIPCFVIMILSLTVFWNEFSWKVSIVIITFIGLSYNAVYYNMEVRMYSWAGLFVLLSYYGLWRILKHNRKRDYIFFVLFSLCAAYTHYFAMVTVAFFYIAILFISIFSKRLSFKAIVIVWTSTVIGYLPWAVIFWKTVQRTANNYWITEIPTFQSALRYLFSSRFQDNLIALVALISAGIIFFLYETKILNITTNKEKCVCVSIAFNQIEFSNILILTITGIFCVLGTIIFAISYSLIVRPVFTYRYIYATSIIAWMVLSFIVSNLKLSKIWIPLLCLFLLTGFIPRYQETYTLEKQSNDTLQNTLDAVSEIDTNDIILTNNTHVPIYTIKYYFPNIPIQALEENSLIHLDKNTCYYLFISDNTDIEAVLKEIEVLGFHYTLIIHQGNLGPNIIDIYQIKNS